MSDEVVRLVPDSGDGRIIQIKRSESSSFAFYATVKEALEIRNKLIELFNGDNPVLLKAERDMWMKRAIQHGCNAEEGDHECG